MSRFDTGGGYVSPLAVLHDLMSQREDRKRQALLDQIAREREDRMGRQADEQLRLQQERLNLDDRIRTDAATENELNHAFTRATTRANNAGPGMTVDEAAAAQQRAAGYPVNEEMVAPTPGDIENPNTEVGPQHSLRLPASPSWQAAREAEKATAANAASAQAQAMALEKQREGFQHTENEANRANARQVAQINHANKGVMAGLENVPVNTTGEIDPTVLQGMNPQQQQLIKSLTEYKYPLPAGTALRTPEWMNILAVATAYDPSFNAAQYGARQKYLNDLSSGKTAGNIKSLDTVVQHLGKMSQSGERLPQHSLPAANWVENTVRTNLLGQSAQKTFETDQLAASHELMRLFREVGADAGAVEAWEKKFSAAASPEQRRDVIGEALELIGGREQSLQEQYSRTMGKGYGRPFFNDKSQELMKTLKSGNSPVATAPLGTPAAASPTAETPEQRLARLKAAAGAK